MKLLEARGWNHYVTWPLIHTDTVNVEQPLQKPEVAMPFYEEAEEWD